jgi:hypothetical protein
LTLPYRSESDHVPCREIFDNSGQFAPPQSQLAIKVDEGQVLAYYTMFALLFDLEDYATTYRATRDAYLKAANELKLATGPYKAARDAYVAATATYTKSLYE